MKNYFFLLIFLLAVSACKKTEFTDQARGALLETSSVGTISKSDVNSYVSEFDWAENANYDVDVVRVSYVSESNGKQVKTDGLLLRPKNLDSVYFLPYFHGTVVPLNVFNVKKSVPSLFNLKKEYYFEVRNIAVAWASAGFTVFMPDYIGYGRTAKEEHPYVYYPELFKSIIDGMQACKTYFQQENLVYDNRVFLAGWSQGAGASLSAHKFIQENHSSEFQVVASSGLAGPYDCKEFLMDVLRRKDESFQMVNIYSWALYSINKFSGIKRPTDQIYKYPVYDQEASFNVQSAVPADLLKGQFIAKLVDGTDTQFLNELDRNTFSVGWTPQGKVFMHHGNADDIVPYFNSQRAHEGLTSAGGDVTFYTYPDGTHVSEVENYVKKTLLDFNLLK